MPMEVNGEKIGQVIMGVPVYNINLNVTGAKVGQIIRVKRVDELGRPLAWEAVDGGIKDGSIGPEKLDREYLELNSIGQVAAPIILTEGTHYGDTAPGNMVKGQLFFIPEEDDG